MDLVGEMCCVVVVWDLSFNSLIWSNNCYSSSETFSGLVEYDLEAMDSFGKYELGLRARIREMRNVEKLALRVGKLVKRFKVHCTSIYSRAFLLIEDCIPMA